VSSCVQQCPPPTALIRCVVAKRDPCLVEMVVRLVLGRAEAGSRRCMRREGDRVVVITGASAGVGRAAALAFARRGVAVALLARGADGLAAARREVESAGGRCVAVPTDVAHPQQVEDAAAFVERELGPVDVWVNNAMTSVFSPACRLEPSEAERVTAVTYLGSVHGTLAALRRMLPRDRGVIVQVS
jgi:NADP-dependent 3-hydroxy acid dehydrogenase YdfG